MEHPTDDAPGPGGRSASSARGPRGARGEIRRRITEAALRSFAEHGYDGASTRGIARDADCDPALVRYYFSTKHDLFEQVVRRPSALDDQLEAMAALPRAERAAYLAGLVEGCWDDPATRDYDARMLQEADALLAARRPGLRLADLLPEVLVAGQDAGTLTPDGAALLDP